MATKLSDGPSRPSRKRPDHRPPSAPLRGVEGPGPPCGRGLNRTDKPGGACADDRAGRTAESFEAVCAAGRERSSQYYRPKGESAQNLALMRRMDELHMAYPFYGSRQLMRHLRPRGASPRADTVSGGSCA